MLLSITACVLAVLVPIVVGVALLIYVRALHSALLTQLSARVSACELQLRETTAAHLQTELAALAADLGALSKTVRKNFGRVWAEMHHDGTLDRNNTRQVDLAPAELDPDLAALLASQSAASAPSTGSK